MGNDTRPCRRRRCGLFWRIKLILPIRRPPIEQREALSAILSIKPLSSRDWLALSGVQLVTDQPMDDVLESLKLSTLTGPNEGYVMVERGIYGVSLWESLSPDLKSRVANDLLPVLFPRDCSGRSRSRKVTGPCLRTAPARAQGAARGASRHREGFSERDRAKIGPLGEASGLGPDVLGSKLMYYFSSVHRLFSWSLEDW